MSYSAAIGALVRTTGWPLDYIMWGVSARALALVSGGIAETYVPDKELLG